MTQTQLDNLAEGVRQEGYEPQTTMKDLVFDPVTGEFRQIDRGSSVDEGDVVTEMTNKGFAAESGVPVIYLDQQDVIEFRKSGQSERLGKGMYWPDENVYHIGLKEGRNIVRGKEMPVRFFSSRKGMRDLVDLSIGLEDFGVVCEGDDVEVYRFKTVDGDEPYGAEIDGPLHFEYIPAQENLYSRAKGILEIGALKDKRVMIVGLGSFGSQIAVELAKAGVGYFSLVDFDRVELHNLMRHTAVVGDLGRLKTDVIGEAILGKNPYANIEKFPININDDLDRMYSEVEKADIVICATDNNTSRFNLSKALVEKSTPGIFGRAITRAEGGDVFRYLPGGPCYCCLIGRGNLQEEEISDAESARRDGRIAAYVSPEDAEAMVQVGLSSDIEPICNMMVKLALVELSRGIQTGITCLEEEFVFDYYMWANRRERHYLNWKPLPLAGSYPAVMRWYGAHIAKEPGCPVCGETQVLETDGGEIDTADLENVEVDFS